MKTKFPTKAVCTAIVLIITALWLYDHGMLPCIYQGPSYYRKPDDLAINWIPVAVPLYVDYIENPIWQLDGMYGFGFWFRSYYFTCEFNTRERVQLKNPSSWTKGNGTDIEKLLAHSDDFLPPGLIQGLKKSEFEYWFRDRYPYETTVLILVDGRYYLFSAGAG